ncbi:hypothetical protein H7I53_20750 [Mycolicibacterium pulveris]|uniref:Uncharacterized protein n=1 Tax=Mycolicibacterium pulveris TaxID=36813 RepID=A0A7I7UH70_MYCPV|nr:hypothetical protein [Mycolicibacterium pulveris]MCV6982641.1 hypothetical protein [Mycolicibacterium pulveris]BBY80430.1 hypothetical protein MPUL_15880 [Mycolicibacterium pulveris]
MTWGSEGQASQPEPQSSDGRPPDVETGFWLWVIALPLMITGYLVDVFGSAERAVPFPVAVLTVMFVVILSAVVLTFLILMRHGYRWARTLLTGGGVASVVYMASSLFTDERHTVAAFTYAVCAIVGSVLIIGGAVLLHRKDAQAFFTR